jgi:biopolymer transport protein ExbB
MTTLKTTKMKRVFAIILLSLGMIFTLSERTFSQTTDTGKTVTTAAVTAETTPVAAQVEEQSGHQILVEKFIEGSPGWMAPILICAILGLAICIERIIFLNLSSINTTRFLVKVEDALKTGGVNGAKEICRNTRGPIASIFYQGLDRSEEGLDVVEKSVVSYGSVQMGQLEKGLIWISLFIALAPMLGFLGTVVGMIQSFDDIEKAGDISATIVARGIKVALLTTVAGLIVAIVLQLFYNYMVSKIDTLVNNMEDASISLVDMLIKYKIIK